MAADVEGDVVEEEDVMDGEGEELYHFELDEVDPVAMDLVNLQDEENENAFKDQVSRSSNFFNYIEAANFSKNICMFEKFSKFT